MNYRAKSILETGIRVKEFLTEPGVPTNARVTSLSTQLGTAITAIENHGADQASGTATARSGTVQRREIAKRLREKLREIADTAKGLDEETYPGAAAHYLMPTSQKYQTLLATGRGFLEDIGPIKAGFVESGLPADFDEQLAAVVAEFAAATTVRDGGLSERRSGTAGLSIKAADLLRIIQKLRAAMKNLLKTSNPAMFAAWQSAAHVQVPRSFEDPEGTPGSGQTATLASVRANVAAAPDEGATGIPALVEPRVNGTNGTNGTLVG